MSEFRICCGREGDVGDEGGGRAGGGVGGGTTADVDTSQSRLGFRMGDFSPHVEEVHGGGGAAEAPPQPTGGARGTEL
jgi:hypothetical protein